MSMPPTVGFLREALDELNEQETTISVRARQASSLGSVMTVQKGPSPENSLQSMDLDVDKTLEYFAQHGESCDCAIVFNMEECVNGGATSPDADRTRITG